MRVFLVSDAPWHTTGYGTQTKVLAHKMAGDGHRVYVFAPGAFHNGSADVEPNVTVLSSHYGDDRWGNTTLHEYLIEFNPDLVLTWLDCQGMSDYGWSSAPFYPWAPIDTWPVPKVERMILGRAEKILVPSRWGQGVLKESGFDSTYVPCGLDMGVFDIDPVGRERWRKQLNSPVTEDTYLIGMVGLNGGSPDRKGYGYAFDALRRFIDHHPDDDIRAYIHTNVEGEGGAINLYGLREETGLVDKVYLSPPPLPLGSTDLFMRDMYNAFDVFLHTSLTEGFGLPVIEAQACGTPVVANSATTVTELVRSGYLAKPLGEMWVGTVTKVSIPDVDGIVANLERAYSQRFDRRAVREGVQEFQWGHVYDTYWRPVLADVPKPVEFEAGKRKLMLAAGKDEKDGFTHHDREKFWPHIDVAHDLEVLPWPWADDSWDYIEFSDCLEHLRAKLMGVMDELWRITAPGGYVYIHTAEAGSWQLMRDPTHIQGFDIHSMDYLDPKMPWGQQYSYSDRKWRVCKRTANNGGLSFILQPRKEQVDE